MRTFIFILSITLSIAACKSDSTGPEPPSEPEPPQSEYPYYNGTWKVTSEDSADWIGTSRSKGDTLEIDTPNGYSLNMIQESDLNSHHPAIFSFIFTDSTTNATEFLASGIEESHMFSNSDAFAFSVPDYSATPNYVQVYFGIGYACDSTLVDNKTKIQFDFLDEEQVVLESKVFYVDGIIQTIHDLYCPS